MWHLIFHLQKPININNFLRIFNPTFQTQTHFLAVTIMPYDDRLVGVDLDKIHEQLKLLEQFTQKTLSSFGEFSEEVTLVY